MLKFKAEKRWELCNVQSSKLLHTHLLPYA